MSLRNDNRGLTIEFVKLLGSLGIGAVITWAVTQAADKLLPDAKSMAPGTMGAVEANGWFAQSVDLLPGVFLLVAFFGFLALAVTERGAAR